jgi:hypothetical protein
LPVGIKYITQLFSAVFIKVYFPAQWKVARIILVLKPGNAKDLTLHRQISVLPIVSEVFEKLLLKRLLPMVGNNINTQSSFRLQAEALNNRTDIELYEG